MKSQRRNQNGATLIAVIGIGLIGGLWLSALMGVVMPSYTRASKGRTDVALRSSAEAALDWAVMQLNIQGSGMDDTSNDGVPGPTVQVPSTVLGTYGLPVTATVQVNNTQPSTGSYLYDPALDPANSATNGGITTNGWRTLTAVANSGANSKRIRIVLRPSYTATPIFDYALFGKYRVKVHGNGYTDSYDSSAGTYAATVSPIGGNVGSNTQLHFNGNGRVGGDAKILSNPPAGTNVVITGYASNLIKGLLIINGLIGNSGGVPHFNSTNVLGQQPDGSVAGQPILTQQSKALKQLQTTPTAPATATNLGAVQLDDSDTLLLNAPGDYIISSLQIEGNGKIQVQGTGRVRLFVQGTSAHIGIWDNGSVVGAKPQDLHLYYNGTNQTTLSGNAQFTGVIYAPNSEVGIFGNSQVFGAIVGNDVHLHDGCLHYDRSLLNNNTVKTMVVSRLQTVTWQEL